MRSTFRGALVALVAVFAFGALASASASAALPEFRPLKGTDTFTGTGGSVSIEEPGGSKYACSSSSITGSIVGPKEVSKVFVKMNCPTGTSFFCKNLGEEKWETKELKGRIAYLSKERKTVGLLLEPVTEPVAECIAFGGEKAKITGSIIGELGEVNKGTNKLSFRLRQSKGLQEWRHFEGEELLHNLQKQVNFSERKPTNVGLETTLNLTLASSLEIVA